MPEMEVPAGPPNYRLFAGTWSRFSERSALIDLPQTAANAHALADALTRIGALAGEPRLVHDASTSECLHALDEFVIADNRDSIFYFASHGLFPNASTQFFRLATGETQAMGDMMRAFGIAEAIDRLTRSGAGRKLVVIDACYSGEATSSLRSHPGVDLDLPQDVCVLFATDPFSATAASEQHALTAFTSSLAEVLAGGLPDRGPQLSVRTIYGHLESATTGRPKPLLISSGNAAERITFRNAGSNGDQSDRFGERVAAFDHRTEILYIDDEDELRSSFHQELQRAGHRVTLAADPREGQQALESGHFDIVVIDLLLRGDVPAIDFIQFCNSRAPDSLLLLVSRRSQSVSEETDSTEERWDRLNAIFAYPSKISAFLWKPDYIRIVTRHANRIRKARRNTLAHIHGLDEGVALVTERMITRDDDLGDRSERLQLEIRVCIERLIEKWFPLRDEDDSEPVYIESMQLRPVTGGRSASTVFTLIPRLRGIAAQSVTPLVLKVGPRSAIEEEVRRYDRFVQVGVPLDVRTDKLDSTLIGHVGGVIYSFRGSDDNEIVEASQLAPAEISTCFDVMFGDSAPKRWYGSEGTGEGIAPYEHFARLGYPSERYTRAWKELQGSLEKSQRGLPPDHPSREERLRAENEWMGTPYTATLVHGDLSLDNIVKISGRRFALIDYMTVGLGPRLVDFVTLEISCWLLARCPDAPRAARFADAYEAVPRTLQLPDAAELPAAGWLGDARSLAEQCRALALYNHPDATDKEYGELLWLAAVRASEFKSRAVTTEERTAQRALLPALALAAQAMIRH
jgi:hypothetical protein